MSLGQFLYGLAKSVAFALQIGLDAGCSAADVGQAATKAVVVGVVGIIVVDSLFAVVAEALGF